jgi:hypothetical protein
VRRMLLGAVVVDLAYWSLWVLARNAVASQTRAGYVEFENAFPLADTWLGLCCLAAWWTLRGRRPIALLWTLAAGSAAAYLAGMDVLYDLQHGIWTSGAGGLGELVINLASILLAAVCLSWSWAHRDELLHPVPAGSS